MRSLENSIRQVMAGKADVTPVSKSLANTIRDLGKQPHQPVQMEQAQPQQGHDPNLYEPGFDEVPPDAATAFNLMGTIVAEPNKMQPQPSYNVESITVPVKPFVDLLLDQGLSESVVDGILKIHGIAEGLAKYKVVAQAPSFPLANDGIKKSAHLKRKKTVKESVVTPPRVSGSKVTDYINRQKKLRSA